MEVDSGHDLLGELPQEIIEMILSKLSIIDAVRTCLLSRSWRYRWTSMTHIVFDDRIVTIPRERLGNIDHEIIHFVDKFLSVHNGPIDKFDLTSHYASSRLHLELYRWLLSVCQRGVKELCVRLSTSPISSYNTAPHCIFSCTKLTRLELQFCQFEPPPSFAGFSRMKHLVLRHFWTPREDMERLISSCPLLESLTLAYFEHRELTIRAPNLKCLNVEGGFVDICLENMPLLVDMTVHVRRRDHRGRLGSHDHGLEKLLDGAPQLKRLCGKGYFARSLSEGADRGAFITYEFLKHIELSSASFDDPIEVLVLLRLILSAPNLQELSIKVVLTSQFMMEEGEFSWDMFVADGTLNRLKLVKINGEIEKPVCLELIKFLLDRSPSLVRMRIEQHWGRVAPMNGREMKELSEKVMRLRRASPEAEVVLLSNVINLKMEVDSCHDLISKLPQEIMETILSKLPITYAVRTCILSRSWRYKWTSMTHILIDNDYVPTHIIDRFLSVHDGPIHTFTLSTSIMVDSAQVDQWFHILSQKDVKELTLQVGHYVRVPDCIFSCMKLTRLTLGFCGFRPPPSFTGFFSMKHLVLTYILISSENTERLISSCPLLESLTLAHINSFDFAIRAPNLKCLNLEGEFRDICLESTPHLTDVTVFSDWVESSRSDINHSSTYAFENLLGGVPKLERLSGMKYFMHSLSARTGGCKFITYEFLKHIELRSVGLDNPKEVSVLLQLIFSSPNLQEVYIQGINTLPFKSEGDLSDWFKDPFLADGTLNQLKLVEINGMIKDQVVCMELVKFLLNRSPSLEMMRIDIQFSSCGGMEHSRKMTQMVVEQLSSVPWASPKASIVSSCK